VKHFLLVAAVLLLGAVPTFGQRSNLDQVAFEQKPNALVDGHAVFKDETGKDVHVTDLLNDRPTILMIGFYECPMLCDPLLQNLATSLKHLPLMAGKDFNVVTISIDPHETPTLAAAKKAELLKAYNRPGTEAGWHCLTGDEKAINAFTASVGYRYAVIAGGQFSHPAGLVILTPDGHISKYLMGMTFQAWTLRLALVDSSQGKIGTVSDAVLLRCYHYDPATGKYGLAIQSALRVGGCLTAAVLFGAIGWFSYRYRQKPEPTV
jgi:protein SCO1/2